MRGWVTGMRMIKSGRRSKLINYSSVEWVVCYFKCHALFRFY